MKWTDGVSRTENFAMLGMFLLLLACIVLLLTSCASETTKPEWCAADASFIQTRATTFDAYRGGTRIATALTFEQIAAECWR